MLWVNLEPIVDVLRTPLCRLTEYLQITQIWYESIRLVELIIVPPGNKAVFAISRHSARAKFTIACAGNACGGKHADFSPFDRAKDYLQNAFLDESLVQKEAENFAFENVSNLPIFRNISIIFSILAQKNCTFDIWFIIGCSIDPYNYFCILC